MADNQKTQLFEEMPIPKAVMQLSIPTVLSSLVMVIYNLADTYFVGMLNNPVQNAAVTLAAPVDVYKRQPLSLKANLLLFTLTEKANGIKISPIAINKTIPIPANISVAPKLAVIIQEIPFTDNGKRQR